MKLNDLLAHYGRVASASTFRDGDEAVRLFGLHHLSGNAESPLTNGDRAPDIWLRARLSSDGAGAIPALPALPAGPPVRLASLVLAGPVVLKFFRGRWCPYCTLELRAWQRNLERLRRLGAQIFAISPQSQDETRSTRLRDGLTLPTISDPCNTVARQFGIAYELVEEERRLMRSMGIDLARVNAWHDPSDFDAGLPGDAQDADLPGTCDGWSLALPALYVIDGMGRIVYSFVDADHRNRAEPDNVLAAIAGLRSGFSRPAPVPGSSW